MENLTLSLSQAPQNKDITIITVQGFLDTTTAPEFEKLFKSALDEKKFKLVIDLTKVDYISSAGWGLFVSEIKRIRNEGGDLVLAGMNPNVMEVFELLDFNSILKFFPDIEGAFKKGFEKKTPGSGKPALSLWKKRVKVSVENQGVKTIDQA